MIGGRKWMAAPKNVQAAMDAAADRSGHAGCTSADDAEAGDLANVRAAGVAMGPLAPPGRARLVDVTGDAGAGWTRRLNRRGKQGMAALRQ